MKSKLIDKLKLFVCIMIVPTIIYFIATTFRKQRIEEIEFIKKDFIITKGIITKKSTYKGNSIYIKYVVNDKVFSESDGFDEKNNFEEGDSVKIKYSKTKPELMISEFNEDY
jgi:ribosomal protein S17